MDPIVRILVVFAGMVVVDGWLVEWLSHGTWSLEDVLTLACLGFSGPGCLTTAMQLKGSVPQRLYHVVYVYAAVGIAAGIVALLHPIFRGLLPPNMQVFVGLYLLSLGLWLSGVPGLRSIAHWSGCGAAMQVMLAMVLTQAVRQGFSGAILGDVVLDWKALPTLALALSIGCGLTAVGAVLGMALKESELIPLKRCAAFSLVANALFGYLGVPLPLGVPTSALTLGPLGFALVWTVAVAVLKQLPNNGSSRWGRQGAASFRARCRAHGGTRTNRVRTDSVG